jgi:adenylate cyclase
MIALDDIRACLEGDVPSLIATCARDGTPNLTYASQVHYVDGTHVALSFQFFNKTRENILAHPYATALVVHPDTAAAYELQIEYLRTESQGPLFESMKARLAGIASHTGMADVFLLRGADVYRVRGIEQQPGRVLPLPPLRHNLMPALRSTCEKLAGCGDLDTLLDTALESLEAQFGVRHAAILVLDCGGQRLYTVASRGYGESGVGSEIAIGAGVIGVCALHRTPIRISHLTSEYAYHRAIRDTAAQTGLAPRLQAEIPFPGLREPHSQLAVPILAAGRLQGVLYLESPQDRAFGYELEDALAALGAQLGFAMHVLQQSQEERSEAPRSTAPPAPAGAAIRIRHYAENDSVFLDEDYLIKGVAGAIFCKLVRDYLQYGRTEFSNRELRLDPSIPLPDVSDNLEARLVLLARRLSERSTAIALEKTGRGRFRLRVSRPLEIAAVPG